MHLMQGSLPERVWISRETSGYKLVGEDPGLVSLAALGGGDVEVRDRGRL
jgi:hypothetical protein